jgi:hypothetical protein
MTARLHAAVSRVKTQVGWLSQSICQGACGSLPRLPQASAFLQAATANPSVDSPVLLFASAAIFRRWKARKESLFTPPSVPGEGPRSYTCRKDPTGLFHRLLSKTGAAMKSEQINYDTMTIDAFCELLPAGEKGNWEWKGRKLLDPPNEENKKRFLDELAKQISGFANTDGGLFIYGLENNKHPTGCVETIGSQSIDDWVGRAIPTLLNPRVPGIELHMIPRQHSPGQHRLLVVEVPSSPSAPHRSSRDEHYYLRMHDGVYIVPHSHLEWLFRRPSTCTTICIIRPKQLTVIHEPHTFIQHAAIVCEVEIKNTSPIVQQPAGSSVEVCDNLDGWFLELDGGGQFETFTCPYIFPKCSETFEVTFFRSVPVDGRGEIGYLELAQSIRRIIISVRSYSQNYASEPVLLRYPFNDDCNNSYRLPSQGANGWDNDLFDDAMRSAALFG